MINNDVTLILNLSFLPTNSFDIQNVTFHICSESQFKLKGERWVRGQI